MNRYGRPLSEWNHAIEEARATLREVARTGNTISYSDLTARIAAVSFEPNEYAFHAFLGEISADEDDAGRGLMTVLVVHKEGDGMPGAGWFQLAKDRGRDVSNKERCWIEERNKVYDAWK